MFDLKAYLTQQKTIINSAIHAILDDCDNKGRIFKAMRYSLDAGGKRIRPILCLAAAEAVGGRTADALQVACAIEMIHTYSLIHDDLPAMDNDDLRRGQPTSHVQFDEATAILAGDALLTLAFETLAQPVNAASSDLRPDLIHLMAQAVGCRGMIEGQMLDILAEGRELTLHELETIHRLKTGALIQASLRAGALLGNGRRQEIELLSAYGRHIGLAFQVMDDILNVRGDPSLMGKAVGSDAQRGKITYPAVIGMRRSEKMASRLIKDALQAIRGLDEKAAPLRAIARYIIERTS